MLINDILLSCLFSHFIALFSPYFAAFVVGYHFDIIGYVHCKMKVAITFQGVICKCVDLNLVIPIGLC